VNLVQYHAVKPQFHRNLYLFDGRLSQRIWARGIVTDYAYDGWGSLTNTVYSDDTPTVTLFYDAMGRQTNAVDAAGVTTFRYDDYGSLTNETVVGAAGENTIVRHWDAYGRTTGYSLVGRAAPSAPQRQTTIGYDAATGRIATMLASGSNVPFTWSYLPGSDLKSSLAYPNGLTASWAYDANGQLLQVRNAVVATAPSPSETEVISQYDYTYDAAGRRIEIARSGSAMSESRTDAYGYNVRNELTSATKTGGPQSPAAEYAYQYDDIGNRITSTDLTTNRTYTANSLNQYTLISNLCDSAALREEFVPQFDDDGNQTLIQTSTGVWSVQYNGENRPVLWTGGTQSAATNIVMSFDRMGRRITKNNQWFVYNGYLQIANFEHSFTNSQLFIWDPTEPIATRPLVWYYGASAAYYTHDGNKNVSEVVVTNGLIVAHYEYVPFGSVIAVNGERTEQNSWRFSSEFTDDEIMLIYYNYRNYAPDVGRWLSMDPLKEDSCRYIFCPNNGLSFIDLLGLELVNINYKYGYKDFRKVGDISYVVNKLPCPTGWVSIDQVELNMSPIDFSKEKDFFQNFQVALMKTFEGYELKIPFTLLQSQWKGKGAVVEAWDESKLLPTKSGLKTHVRHCIKERFWIEVVESGFNLNIAWFGTFSLMRGEPYQFGESSYLEVCGPFCCTE